MNPPHIDGEQQLCIVGTGMGVVAQLMVAVLKRRIAFKAVFTPGSGLINGLKLFFSSEMMETAQRSITSGFRFWLISEGKIPQVASSLDTVHLQPGFDDGPIPHLPRQRSQNLVYHTGPDLPHFLTFHTSTGVISQKSGVAAITDKAAARGMYRCFRRGAMVRMADGALRAIETIRPGEQVLTPKGSNTVLLVSMPIRGKPPLYAINHRCFQFAATHPFVLYGSEHADRPHYVCVDPVRLMNDTPTLSMRGILHLWQDHTGAVKQQAQITAAPRKGYQHGLYYDVKQSAVFDKITAVNGVFSAPCSIAFRLGPRQKGAKKGSGASLPPPTLAKGTVQTAYLRDEIRENVGCIPFDSRVADAREELLPAQRKGEYRSGAAASVIGDQLGAYIRENFRAAVCVFHHSLLSGNR